MPHFGAGPAMVHEAHGVKCPMIYAAPVNGTNADAHAYSMTTAAGYPSAMSNHGVLCGERETCDDTPPFGVTLGLRIHKPSIIFKRKSSNQIGLVAYPEDYEIEAIHFLPRSVCHPEALKFPIGKTFMDQMWTTPALFPWTVRDENDTRIPEVISEEERNSTKRKKLRNNLANMDRRGKCWQGKSPVDMQLTARAQARAIAVRQPRAFQLTPQPRRDEQGRLKGLGSRMISKLRSANTTRREVFKFFRVKRRRMAHPVTAKHASQMESVSEKISQAASKPAHERLKATKQENPATKIKIESYKMLAEERRRGVKREATQQAAQKAMADKVKEEQSAKRSRALMLETIRRGESALQSSKQLLDEPEVV